MAGSSPAMTWRNQARLEGALLFWEQPMVEIPDNARRARQMYADGKSVAAIKAETEMTGHAIYFWLGGGPQIAGRPTLEPIPRRVTRTTKVTPDDRRAMIARIMRSCDKQISEIERRVNPSPTQLDHDSRRLALISRTLNELTAIDQRNSELKRKNVQPNNDKSGNARQAVPRDADELRRSLARKLEAIIAERNSEAPADRK
jgi:hypothetical protein